MHSCLYEGRVRHRRSRPVEHAFGFPLLMLYLDLSELPGLFRGRWLWSAERPAFAWYRRRDHLGDPAVPLERCVRDLVEAKTGLRPMGPIRLLTHLRYGGYLMNPVSFFYCFDAGAQRLVAVVAEVNNTPWGERHCYVLPVQSADPFDPPELACVRTRKEFHVSPFMRMEQFYSWRFREPADRLELSVTSCDLVGAPGPDAASSNFDRRDEPSIHAGSSNLDRACEPIDVAAPPHLDRFAPPIFEASLMLERREIARHSLSRALLRYPFMCLQIVAAIYWQALRLRLKGAPFFAHPRERKPELELAA